MLSKSEVFVPALASYVGFPLDAQCREMALFVLDHVARNALDAEQQVRS
jgi:hypothetical protein